MERWAENVLGLSVIAYISNKGDCVARRLSWSLYRLGAGSWQAVFVSSIILCCWVCCFVDIDMYYLSTICAFAANTQYLLPTLPTPKQAKAKGQHTHQRTTNDKDPPQRLPRRQAIVITSTI